ncbi:MAG TPA: CPBP family intramembrane glutamic endopeptidase [Rhizomicrobium sp.]|nr:CPBP family intramembrane glutamic endopeptidase [Rhizomicrobium sp.]
MSGRRRPFVFFALVFALTIPFWLLSSATGAELLPKLPVAALAVICPALAALFLGWREGGAQEVRALLGRLVQFRGGAISHVFAFFLPFLAGFASCAWLRAAGVPVPTPDASVISVFSLFALFLPGAICEELGWTGYALDPLQRKYGALPAALIIGAVWALWHVPALAQADRDWSWIAWWCLGTVSTRVIMVWLYNATRGSVPVAILLHTAGNLAWQLFPVHGSYYDPKTTGILLFAIAAVVSVLPKAKAA